MRPAGAVQGHPRVLPQPYSQCWAASATSLLLQLGTWSPKAETRVQEQLCARRVMWVHCGKGPCPVFSLLSPVWTLCGYRLAWIRQLLCSSLRSSQETLLVHGQHNKAPCLVVSGKWTLCVPLCVYWGEEGSGHSEETCKSPPEFVGGAFGLIERRHW